MRILSSPPTWPMPVGLLPVVLVLASCSSPPQLPGVDESRKHPANAAVAVELQVCKSALQDTRILAGENERAAEIGRAAMASGARTQSIGGSTEQPQDAANSVYSVHFDFGSTRVAISEADAARLIGEARAAPLVLLRGRTDGATESRAESHIARARADAVRSYLVHAGVDATHIRATWQPIGDSAANNASPAGRALNRRVEIEIYRIAPRSIAPIPQPST